MINEQMNKAAVLKTKKNQPIKNITQEDIKQLFVAKSKHLLLCTKVLQNTAIENVFRAIVFRVSTRAAVGKFFSYQTVPLSKKKIIRDSYARSAMYLSFQKIFFHEIDAMEMKLEELEKCEKVKI